MTGQGINMKKAFVVFSILLTVVVFLTSCSSSNEQSSNLEIHETSTPIPTKKVDPQYAADFDRIYDELVSFANDATFVTTHNIKMWQAAGSNTEFLLTRYSVLWLIALSGKVDVGTYKPPYSGYMIDAFGKGNVLAGSISYENATENISNNLKKVKENISQLRSNYPNYKDGIDALENLYSKIQEYANFATNLEDTENSTLSEYISQNETFQKAINELKDSAYIAR